VQLLPPLAKLTNQNYLLLIIAAKEEVQKLPLLFLLNLFLLPYYYFHF